MPMLGFGTSGLRGEDAAILVADAIGFGYRLIDTAGSYENESEIGHAIHKSGVPREELFVTTKFDAQYHGYEEAQQAFSQSTRRLGTEYLDLFLIHWPMPALNRYVDSWRAMIKLLEEGRVRAIGVANFKSSHIDRLLEETGVAPHVNQIHLNPKAIRTEELRYHVAHGIQTEASTPLDRGKESVFWHGQARKWRRRLRGWGGNLLEERVIRAAAERHSKTEAQVVLRWHVQQGIVAIPKTRSRHRMAENLNVFDFELSLQEMNAISALDRGDQRVRDSDLHGH